jgi:hypothetical protein
VQAWTSKPLTASAAARFSVRILATALAASPAGARSN